MIRFSDWEQRLAEYLEPLREREFAYGKHDCCTFVDGAVEAMTGAQSMGEFKGRYSSRRGSAVALGRYGMGTLAATLDSKFEVVPIGFAHRGDIVLVDDGQGLALVLGQFAIRPGDFNGAPGLIRSLRHEWERAWHV